MVAATTKKKEKRKETVTYWDIVFIIVSSHAKRHAVPNQNAQWPTAESEGSRWLPKAQMVWAAFRVAIQNRKSGEISQLQHVSSLALTTSKILQGSPGNTHTRRLKPTCVPAPAHSYRCGSRDWVESSVMVELFTLHIHWSSCLSPLGETINTIKPIHTCFDHPLLSKP